MDIVDIISCHLLSFCDRNLYNSRRVGENISLFCSTSTNRGKEARGISAPFFLFVVFHYLRILRQAAVEVYALQAVYKAAFIIRMGTDDTAHVTLYSTSSSIGYIPFTAIYCFFMFIPILICRFLITAEQKSTIQQSSQLY